MLKGTSIILIGVSISLCWSCAAIIHGSKQNIDVTSDPPGARIYLNGSDTQKETPAKISVRRKSGTQFVKFERPGFEPRVEGFSSRFNMLVLVDFMWFFPGIIDLAVGSHYVYDKSINVQLQKTKSEAIVSSPLPLTSAYQFQKLSDVDHEIPIHKKEYANRYALIIGNENYSSFQRSLSYEVNVAFARDDASAFAEYAKSLLGVPERNITLLLDATSAEMQQGLAKMHLIAKNSGGKAEFFVFYAGHGLPDEATKEPYLMPVDVSGSFVHLALPLKEFYNSLTEYPTERISVFIDACFSGGARNQGLVAARGVRVTPRETMVKGNMVVFTASAAEESALPYTSKNHGLFTYYLLKKLKETDGTISYKELSQYLEEKMPLESVLINNKEQHPKTIISSEVINTWESWVIN
jgi:hypothetical protein